MVSLERLWGLVSAARVALEEAAARKADPLRRTAADHLVAVLALLLAFALVLGSIALGWLALWRLTLHKIGMFRDILGLNRATKESARRKAELQMMALKRQINALHGFGPGAARQAGGDEASGAQGAASGAGTAETPAPRGAGGAAGGAGATSGGRAADRSWAGAWRPKGD